MPDRPAEHEEVYRRFLEFHENFISAHVAKVTRENDPRRPAVASVAPLWDRLARAPLRRLAATRMIELLREAMQSRRLQVSSEPNGDLQLIVSVVPACRDADVREHFDGYAEFTMTAGAADALAAGRWVAHWTLCTDGTRSPRFHLTVLPSDAMRAAGPALMLWARDLFTEAEWADLPGWTERFFSATESSAADPDEVPLLISLAEEVAGDPGRWTDAVGRARGAIPLGALRTRLANVWGGDAPRTVVTPEPVGFLAATLCYELLRDDPGTEPSFAHGIGLWAAAHPVAAVGLLPIRTSLFEKLAAATDRSREPFLWASLQQGFGNALMRSHPDNPAPVLNRVVAVLQAALTVFTRTDHPVAWAATQHSLGVAYQTRAGGVAGPDIERAIRCFRLALLVRTREAAPREWADATLLLGACLPLRTGGELNDNQEAAIQCHLAALCVYSEAETPKLWAEAQNSLGTIYAARIDGDRVENVEEAIRCCHQALRVYHRDSDPTEWAMVMNNLGADFDERGRGVAAENVEEAIRCYRDALTVRTSVNAPRRWAITQNNLGNALLNRSCGNRASDIEEAIASFRAALTVRTRETSPSEWAMTKSNLGFAYLERRSGDGSENVEAAISHLTAALDVRRREVMPAEWAETVNNLGNAYRERVEGDREANRERAATCYRDAAEAYEQLGIRREALRALRNLGRLEISRKNWSESHTVLERAARFAEQELTGSLTELARVGWMRETSGVYEALVAAHLLGGAADGAEQAGYWAEQGRARYLADLAGLAERTPVGVSEEEYRAYRAALHRVRDLDQRAEALERHRATLEVNSPRREEIGTQIAALRATRDSAAGQVRTIQTRFTESAPDWAFGAEPMSPEALREVARTAGAAVLTLRPSSWGTCVILVRADGPFAGIVLKELTTERVQEFIARPANEEPMSGWMVAYNRYCSAATHQEAVAYREWCQELDRTLGELGETLWQPVRRWLSGVYPPVQGADEPRPLILIPGQSLSAFPLHACWWIDDRTRRWAGDEYRISYAPSFRVLRRSLRHRAKAERDHRRLLAVCNPTGDLNFAPWEVEGVCAMFPSHIVLGKADSREPATRERLKRELPRFPFALLATHGTYDLGNPWTRTGLCTADGPKDAPGQPCLTLADLLELDLASLELAFLSACESAVSDYRDPAGEQTGLPSALLSAGAATVVGSLWLVDDLATALLSRRFFHELFRDTGDHPPAALALWRAQRWLRELTSEELRELTSDLPDHLRGHSLDRATRNMVRVSDDRDSVPSTRRPFEHAVYWSGFACHGGGLTGRTNSASDHDIPRNKSFAIPSIRDGATGDTTMRRVCILKDLGRGWGIVLGEGFTPSADEIRKLTAAKLLKGVRKITSGRVSVPFDLDPVTMREAVTGWAARYPERVDPTAVQWEIVDLEQLGQAIPPAKPTATPKNALPAPTTPAKVPTTPKNAPAPVASSAPTPTTPPVGKVVTPTAQKGAKLSEVLASAATAAAREGLLPFVYFFADWCSPCRMLRRSMTHPLMVKAFRGTYVVQLRIDDWESQAKAAGLDVSAVPVFFRLDPTGRAGDAITGAAWGENTPENMSGPLGAFFSTIPSAAPKPVPAVPFQPASPPPSRSVSGRVAIRDPKGLLRAWADNPPSMIEANPDLEGKLARLSDRLEKANYLEPYFFHPDAAVRSRAAALCVPIDVHKFSYYLVNFLADPDAGVRRSAATALWKRHGDEYCEYAVKSLRDEIRGHDSSGQGANDIGPSAAREALKELFAAAPTATARERIRNLIRDEIAEPSELGLPVEPVTNAAASQTVAINGSILLYALKLGSEPSSKEVERMVQGATSERLLKPSKYQINLLSLDVVKQVITKQNLPAEFNSFMAVIMQHAIGFLQHHNADSGRGMSATLLWESSQEEKKQGSILWLVGFEWV